MVELKDGTKYDGDKPIMSLLPFEALREVAKILTFGAKKYDAHNWRKGMRWSRIESALLRHYERYAMGEDIDPESGLLHTAHLACNALFLLSYQLLKLGTDDRWKPSDQSLSSACSASESSSHGVVGEKS